MSLKHLVTATAKKHLKNFGTPNPPNRGAKATAREVVPLIQGRTCEAGRTKRKQGNTVLIPSGNRRAAASYARHGCWMGTSSSHIARGHGDKALISNGMLPTAWVMGPSP